MPKALSDELLKKLPLKSILKNREPGPISPEYYAKHHPTSSVPTSNAETSKRYLYYYVLYIFKLSTVAQAYTRCP